MQRQWRAVLAAATLVLGVALTMPAPAQDTNPNSASTPRSPKKAAAGEKEAKKLLLLMDADKNGKVSKQEFMSFMEMEFERLDKNKDGELDVKELTESRVRAGRPNR